MNIWFKVRIKSCSSPDYWYRDRVGTTLIVKEPHPFSWGYETKRGFSIFRQDCELIKKDGR